MTGKGINFSIHSNLIKLTNEIQSFEVEKQTINLYRETP